MTASRDPDRLIHQFVLEGEEQLDDQVFDAVRAEIEHKPQRAFVGPWRMPTMSKIVGFGLAAAAVVAIVLIGSQVIGSNPNGLGADPTPIATPEPTPTPVPSLAEPSSSAGAFLPEGPFLVQDTSAPADAPLITGRRAGATRRDDRRRLRPRRRGATWAPGRRHVRRRHDPLRRCHRCHPRRDPGHGGRRHDRYRRPLLGHRGLRRRLTSRRIYVYTPARSRRAPGAEATLD